ncbi:MAG: ATP-binding protein [Oryzomonas sp.]|uniref:sensor histidine kinase n=1 Tax=Oryzomonas sp. TaxID=2855186 RepID=UPI00283DA856|nr:ATP-binding protein [Oryzomonas sp.]MDR3580604.1 ATP-binding protein [Oryzomonas sp.]
MTSIKGRLFTILFTGLIAIIALTGWSVYLRVIHELDVVFDYQLMEVAYSASLNHSDLIPLPSSETTYEREAHLAVQVWKGKELVYASNPARLIPAQRQGLTTLYLDQKSSDKKGWRLFTLYSFGKMVQVSQPLEARRELAIKIALRTVKPLMVASFFLIILILLTINYSLKSLKRVAGEISNRSFAVLEPIEERNLPQEVVPMVECINTLLEHLSRAFDQQSRFIADAAHELRTPLATIQLQAHILKRSSDEEEKKVAHEQLKAGIERASHMVSQLLALARLEPEMHTARPETLSLDEQAQEIVDSYEKIANKKGVRLYLVENEQLSITGEAEALRELMSNLVGNAINYTPPGDIVTVAVRRMHRTAVFEVCDTGPGIPPEERERVFERFYRMKGAANGGSGLGLSIVKSALDRLGGTITLGEGYEGKGLKATVEFSMRPPGG